MSAVIDFNTNGERVRCRNQRCRTKLAIPTDNHHKAFCTPHCHGVKQKTNNTSRKMTRGCEPSRPMGARHDRHM